MISIIVPTYNEEQNIMRFQENLEQLKGDFEVIFSDGFSSDNTYNLIRFKKIRETKYRANQMNSAAKYAKGEYLWFVHADSIVHPDSVLKISEQNDDAGAFKLKFDTDYFWLNLLAFGSNYRVLSRNIAFGDQGIFVKREVFNRLGGFKPIPIMEDYEFSMTLKDNGIPLRRIDLPIITSTRRYKKYGIWETNAMMQSLQRKYRKARREGRIEEVVGDMKKRYEHKGED